MAVGCVVIVAIGDQVGVRVEVGYGVEEASCVGVLVGVFVKVAVAAGVVV